jgi:ferric-dicitrate binding protein FerR (iron transport regulator)
MGRLVIWIRRIPLWVWVFLAATQVLTLGAAPYRLSRLEQALQRMPSEPAYAEVRERFEEIRREERFQLAGAAILAPLFLGLAFWRWSRSRSDTARTA